MEAPEPRPVRLMSEDLANQIAAGEVVERPASVLKELLENALDAHARRIVVEIEAGGRGLIRVVDDGHGMGADDLLLALERHATSKLSDPEELQRVASLGFRGEALPAIASVSRLTLRSRRANDETGQEAVVNGGSLRVSREVGCPIGTTVEVRDLFFNTPARRKFLKSQATESAHLAETFLRLALARPQTGFVYRDNGRLAHDLPPDLGLEPRVAALLGREAVAQMVELEEAVGPLAITGLAGLPSLSRPQADQVLTFVNGRFVRDRVLLSAVGQAYRGLLPPDRRPVLVINIALDPGLVDVNVHPAKTEVRFRHSGEVHAALAEGLRRGLAQARVQSSRPVPRPPAPLPSAPVPSPARPRTELTPPGPAWPSWRDNLPPRVAEPAPARVLPLPGAMEPEPTPSQSAAPPRPRPLFGPAGDLTVIGQLHGLYILCSAPSGLVIVDQHAAHERLTYQALNTALDQGRVPRQGLLAPPTLDLSPAEDALARELADQWEVLGLEISPLGGRTWMIAALPAVLGAADPVPLLRDLLSRLAGAGVAAGTPEFLEAALRSLACHGSIRQGQRLSQAEMEELVRRLASLPPPLTCPHGRPVLLSLPRGELARLFRRGYEED